MPKVGSSLSEGGIQAKPKSYNSNIFINNNNLNRSRNKRDVTDIYANNNNGNKRRGRVVKKLVRVQLVTNNRFHDNSDVYEGSNTDIVETTTKRRRRKLKIKKKKRLLDNNFKNISLHEEENLQAATRPRKKIIVTRKRLLATNRYSSEVSYSETDIPIITTSAYSNIIDSTDEFKKTDDEYEETSEENEIADDSDDTYEDYDEEEEDISDYTPDDADEDYEDTTTQRIEVVTLKESEFFYPGEDEANNDQYSNEVASETNNNTVIPENIQPVTEVNSESKSAGITTTTEKIQETPKTNIPPIPESTSESKPIITTTTEEIQHYPKETPKPINKEIEKIIEKPVFQDILTETTSESKKDVLTTTEESRHYLAATPDPIFEDIEEFNNKPTFQDIPEYEPYFPELTESLDDPIIIFKTTVLTSTELLTKTTVQSRLRTYTFVVTTIAGNEQIVTSTTEVKPHTKTIVTTETVTKLTTLTLLDIDATTTLTSPQQSISSVLDNIQSIQDNQIRSYDEARNLATRVMSNGVEVIVAGDKTIPGEKDYKRFLTSGSYKPVTLKPSTLTENMVMLLPQDSSNIDSLTSSLYPNQFITKTCLTTFTYLTTFLEGSTTTVSSHEQVVSNIATEERNTGKILPTPAVGVTLTQNPNLSVGVFHTTYTYLNTILDGDQPLVVSSKHTVTNTITAPDDYLSLLKVSGTLSPIKDTNTYYSTIGLEKTLYEGNKTSVTSTREVVTQVVITESVPPKATSVMTSYIALDFKDGPGTSFITTDVIKTYFVTYTYYNTITENDLPVVYTNISVSSDVVTEKLYIIPKTSSKADTQSKEQILENNFQIFTTKSYLTTFTYFTTLLQEENIEQPTVINSRTSVVENLVSETVDLSLLDKSNLNQIREAIEDGSNSVIQTITLYNGETFEITAIANKIKENISPTKVLPIEKTQMPESLSLVKDDKIQVESSPSIITGSTIVFIDDDPFAQLVPTPVLKKSTEIKTNEIVTSESLKASKSLKKSKRSTKSKTKSQEISITPTKSKKHTTEISKPKQPYQEKIKENSTNNEKIDTGISPENDLLGLGSINIESMQAIAPFLNSMAEFLTTNLKANRRSDVNVTTTTIKTETEKAPKPATHTKPKIETNDQIVQADTKKDVLSVADTQSRSPIYIPVRGLDDDFEIAESQNIATFDWIDPPPSNLQIHELHAHESSLISHGIPISPGDVITTNSDVIVGKPGRVGPRIPSIPLQNVNQVNEIPFGMKPPPLSSDPWKKKNHEYKRIPVADNYEQPSQYSQENYLGPPPALQNPEYNIVNDNINEISGNAPAYVKNQKNYDPINNQQYNNQQYYNFQQQQQPVPNNGNNRPIYPQMFNHEIPIKFPEEIATAPKPHNINIKPAYSFQDHHQHAYTNNPSYAQNYNNEVPVKSYEEMLNRPKPHAVNNKPVYNFQEQQQHFSNVQPVYAPNHNHEIPIKLQEEILTGAKLNTINIKPSVINNEPIILPEVIERSTGQPLLVNIQPSQVAFVNIPYNRTTALIYGGSTEPHRNGQYFDDPSPYPQPEYSGIEVNEGSIPIASIYQPDLPNQKQVNGVIKVENQLIRNEPISSENQQIQVNIQPTKIESQHVMQENQLNKIPPVSYGMIHHGSDFNAHIINHNDMYITLPGSNNPPNLYPPKEIPNLDTKPLNDFGLIHNNNQKEVNNVNYRKPINNYHQPNYNQEGISDNFIKKHPEGPLLNPQNKNQNLQKFNNNNKKNILRPNTYTSPKKPLEISEFMLPPTTPRIQTKRPYDHKPNKRPISIPVIPNKEQETPKLPPDFKPSYPIYEVHLPPTNINPNIYQSIPIVPNSNPYNNPVQTAHNPNYPHIQTAPNPNPYQPIHPAQNPYQPPQRDQSINNQDVNVNSEIGNHKDDDLENEDGEVVQESNTHPLLPGQVPHEIIKFQASSTEQHPSLYETRPVFVGNAYSKPSTTPLVYHTTTKRTIDKVVRNKTTLGVDLLNGINSFFNEIVNQNNNNIKEDTPSYVELNKTNIFGIGSHEIVSAEENKATKGTTRKPVLIFIDEKEESKDKFFNKNYKDRPAVTSLPINTFMEYNNKATPSVTSRPVDKFNEYNNRDRPTVTSLPINKIKESNTREGLPVTSLPTNTFKEINNRNRPTVTSLPINNFKEHNRDRPSDPSLATNSYKDYNRPTVTSQPINIFKEFNSRPTVTSLPINKFNTFNNRERPHVMPIAVHKETHVPNGQNLLTQVPNEQNLGTYVSNGQNLGTNIANGQNLGTHVSNGQNLGTNIPNGQNLGTHVPNGQNLGTQTEKPFSGVPSKTVSFNEIVKKDVTRPKPLKTTHFTRTTTTPVTAVDKVSHLNSGEVPISYNNSIKPISDMEIMKPPPLIPDIPKQSSSIKPNTYTTVPINVEESLSTLYAPHLSEEMVPPPPQNDQKVIGMVPPPLTSPKLPPKITTPQYSMEIDVPSTKTTTTTEVHRTRTRRPYTRRPGSKTTTTTNTPTTFKRRPVYPGFTSSSTTETVQSTTPKVIISPSPSIKIKPSLEIIIGNPSLNDDTSKPSSTTAEISSSEITVSTQKSRDEADLLGMESGQPSVNSETSSNPDIIAPAVHHAGNEIKVILDPTIIEPTSIVESTTPLPPTTKTFNDTKSKIPLPTRYITHTKTATVTITKTTVIKSLGMTPSTLTILVTKTEKTTVVDTVTEVHTLVKPTSIVETITTTIKQASSLYPADAYGSPYPSIQVKPTLLSPLLNYNDTVYGESSEENLEEFIIHETDPPITKEKENEIHGGDNESILVVMTDKNTKNIVKVPTNYETQERDEIITTNKDNNILLGGILIDHPEDKQEKILDRCEPECKASRNELCQKLDGIMRCSCRPGFARMFPDRPCLPTYTFNLKLTLDRIGKDPLHFYDDLKNPNSTEHFKFVQATSEALDRMVMQSDLRDIFHGVKVHTFEPATKGIVSKFHLQLSENIEEDRLEDELKKYLSNNSFSLGGTDIFASPLMELEASDFDECAHVNLHDCSENAHCFNLKGTYSCSCKEGYSDLSENMLYPGRICSAEQIGCEKCNYHGTCYSRGTDEILCECFQWYTGQSCHINLKVLLIALVTLGTLLFGLLLTCIILTCVKGKPRSVGVSGGINFLPQGNSTRRNTLDRKAMIQDTSSEEDNKSETSRYVKKQKAAPQKKTSKVSLQLSERAEGGNVNHGISFDDQKDRSLTVMIPRAKYHPAPPTSPLSNYTSFDARKPSVPSINEAKLLSFLDAGPSPNKSEPTRKFSNAPSESIIEEKPNSRKTSGALISAGFEVSATVVNNMGTLGTTCGTEADRSENATLIQKISADLLSSTGTRSQFNTLRKSLVDEDMKSEIDMDNASNWLDMLPRVMTVSEARSYDETTIPPPMKCLRPDYDSKPSSQHPNDEANTMAERDLGSTFMLPHTHLYKPDRGSDISGFESL